MPLERKDRRTLFRYPQNRTYVGNQDISQAKGQAAASLFNTIRSFNETPKLDKEQIQGINRGIGKQVIDAKSELAQATLQNDKQAINQIVSGADSAAKKYGVVNVGKELTKKAGEFFSLWTQKGLSEGEALIALQHKTQDSLNKFSVAYDNLMLQGEASIAENLKGDMRAYLEQVGYNKRQIKEALFIANAQGADRAISGAIDNMENGMPVDNGFIEMMELKGETIKELRKSWQLWTAYNQEMFDPNQHPSRFITALESSQVREEFGDKLIDDMILAVKNKKEAFNQKPYAYIERTTGIPVSSVINEQGVLDPQLMGVREERVRTAEAIYREQGIDINIPLLSDTEHNAISTSFFHTATEQERNDIMAVLASATGDWKQEFAFGGDKALTMLIPLAQQGTELYYKITQGISRKQTLGQGNKTTQKEAINKNIIIQLNDLEGVISQPIKLSAEKLLGYATQTDTPNTEIEDMIETLFGGFSTINGNKVVLPKRYNPDFQVAMLDDTEEEDILEYQKEAREDFDKKIGNVSTLRDRQVVLTGTGFYEFPASKNILRQFFQTHNENQEMLYISSPLGKQAVPMELLTTDAIEYTFIGNNMYELRYNGNKLWHRVETKKGGMIQSSQMLPAIINFDKVK